MPLEALSLGERNLLLEGSFPCSFLLVRRKRQSEVRLSLWIQGASRGIMDLRDRLKDYSPFLLLKLLICANESKVAGTLGEDAGPGGARRQIEALRGCRALSV